jgi:hypothetical protein
MLDDISAHFNDCTMSSGIRRAASISAARAMIWDVNSRMPSSTLLFGSRPAVRQLLLELH